MVLAWQQERINVISKERDSYKQNTYGLLGKIEQYQTKENLNVASISQLELKLSELSRFRLEDIKLIETLKVDKKRLQQITTAQTQTIYELSATVRDSFIYVDNYLIDTLHCINIAEEWFNLHGCIDVNNKFAGRFESRDSLLYVEHIVPKKFLFFKWGVKERRQEIVSRNPHTKIIGAEFISIKGK
jgi:hypothetical protein